MALNMYKSFICPFLDGSCSITAVMLSWPGAFLCFRVFIASYNCFRVKSLSSACSSRDCCVATVLHATIRTTYMMIHNIVHS
jgi:hypothetical protein